MRKENESISKHSKKCIFTEIYKKKSDCLNPVLVAFQNGELKEQCEDLTVDLTRTTSGTNVEVKTSFGHVFKESQVNRTRGQTQILAIRNKKNNKMRLVEVDSSLLINSALVTTPVETVSDTEYSKGIKNLYKTFGGKKAISQVIRSEKLNFSSMPVADELKQTIAEMKVDAESSVNHSEAESMFCLLPPCHRDSTVISDVYRIEEILTEKELQALIQEVEVMKENKFNPNMYSTFFMNCYAEAKKHEQNLTTRLAGVLFIEVLVKFLNIQPKFLKSKKEAFCPFSSLINEKILNEFCIRKEYTVTRPLNMKDKCICHIIAICLACCNYQINLKSLQSTIKSTTMKRLAQLAKVVGALPESKDGDVYILKLPLPSLPKSQKAKSKRK